MSSAHETTYLTLYLALYLAGYSNQQLHQLYQHHGEQTETDDFARAIHQLGDGAPYRRWRRWHLHRDAVLADRIAEVNAWRQHSNHHLVAYFDLQYPPLLQQTSNPPFWLFARGRLRYLNMAYIAVVGARQCSPLGIRTTQEFARSLGANSLGIVSGMALGIDTAAHTAALDIGAPTIAVLGAGMENIYPKRNAALAERIAAEGLLLSEFTPSTPPRREHFPQRNRVISGLALGTLVVEASLRSGSLITARLAAEQGREVFAIPGAINNPYSAGCLRLINNGATLVSSSEQMLQSLQPLLSRQHQLLSQKIAANKQANKEQASIASAEADVDAESDSDISANARKLLGLMEYRLMHVDELCQLSQMQVAEVSSLLMELEMNGLVACQSGSYQKLSEP